MRLIELTQNLAVIPCPGLIVKRTGETCAIFLPGSSPIDGGFQIDDEYENVLDQINDALEGKDDR